MVLVPREPTPAMIKACLQAALDFMAETKTTEVHPGQTYPSPSENARRCWRAMVKAAGGAGRKGMSDIVERLRICAKFDPDQAEAADEIERLRAALRGLLEWAGPIAGDTQIVSERAYEEETVAIARAALGEKE